jgi:hypothetical protein
VASSARRSLVMMVGVPGKMFGSNLAVTRRSATNDDQRYDDQQRMTINE